MKGILLLSDGIDSPVAGYLMKKRGIDITALSFYDKNKDTTESRVKKLLSIIDKKAELVMLDQSDFQRRITQRCNQRYQCVLCKRNMYRHAQAIAKKEGAKFIITGENLGQVASQTLDNMSVLDSAVDLTVLRPLLGFEKNEIVELAKKFGTFEISKIKTAGCRFVPKSPITKAKLAYTLEQEKKLTK